MTSTNILGPPETVFQSLEKITKNGHMITKNQKQANDFQKPANVPGQNADNKITETQKYKKNTKFKNI